MKRKIALLLSVFVCITAAYTLSLRSLRSKPVDAEKQNFRIVLDAGHGGMDGGVTGKSTGVKESDLNLSVAYALNEVFSDAGFDVVMTRKTSFGLCEGGKKWTKNGDMRIRKEIIRNASPLLVISVHQNSFPSATSIRGAQVFYDRESEKGKKLALAMQKRLNGLYQKYGAKERNATASEYYVIKDLDFPAIIIECGFLSNLEDEALLTTESYRKKLAKSVFEGAMSFFEAE